MVSLFATVILLAQIWGGPTTHLVQSGDSLRSLGARFGVDVRVLADLNNLRPSENLTPGMALKIDNAHIIPSSSHLDIVINIPQRMLFLFERGHLSRAYPVTAGSAGWKTPVGDFTITSMEKDPTWDVPLSIQEEMRLAGKPVLTRVPPSPANPLGEYWIGLSLSAVGIHGTNAPESIYKLVSHGCIRLHPDDIRDLFALVQPGMRGRVIYEPVLLAEMDGHVFLEVHPDLYKKVPDMQSRVDELARTRGVTKDAIDWQLVKEVIIRRGGIARAISRE